MPAIPSIAEITSVPGVCPVAVQVEQLREFAFAAGEGAGVGGQHPERAGRALGGGGALRGAPGLAQPRPDGQAGLLEGVDGAVSGLDGLGALPGCG
jgi:hypothetical protein